ncbi:hypothetical protein D3C71_2122470 [compost metagenome]
MPAVGEPFVLFVDLLKLTRLRVEFVEFLQLIVQQFGARRALLTLLLMLCQFAAALMPLTIVFSHQLSERVLTGIAI